MRTTESLHRLFREQVARTPTRDAVICERQALSFKRLDELSNSLAVCLKNRGVERGSRVGLLLDLSCEFVVSYLAVLKAGGCCVPIDNAYPSDFIYDILEKSSAVLSIVHQHHMSRLSQAGQARAVVIDNEASWSGNVLYSHNLPTIEADDWAFISFTSGSTGAPKGVPMSHGGAIHSYTTRYDICDYDENQRVACNIFFIWEFLRPLLHGASVYVVPHDVIFDPPRIMDFIRHHGITEILFTPSLFARIVNAVDAGAMTNNFKSLRTIWLNGEVVTEKLRNQALAKIPDHVRLLNTYSICECHDVADFDLRSSIEVDADVCPVGKKRDGVTVRLLPEDGETNIGELCIGGPGLAAGYLTNPELTSERFVDIGGQRYYRTGDRAILAQDGLIQITGRIDLMAKIRGYSIHLGAVETAVRQHRDVIDCSVVSHGEEGSDKKLVVYLVKSAEATWTIDPCSGLCHAIRSFLETRLPHYMIPSIFVEIDSLPISDITGKIDKKKLPAPLSRQTALFDDIELSSSASIMTKKNIMRTIWSRILQQPEDVINDDSNFFDFGGDSLLAVELTLIIEKTFKTRLRVTDIFENPTVNLVISKIDNYIIRTNKDKEIELESSSGQRSSPVPFRISNRPIRNILITGSTGFLGSFIVDEISRNAPSDVHLYCLIRGNDRDESLALARQLKTMNDYGILTSAQRVNITPIVGDIRKEKFGLSDIQYADLANKVDAVLHCASLVNLSYPYSLVEKTIVFGMQNVIDFAKTDRNKVLFHISTNGIYPNHSEAVFLEDHRIDEFGIDLIVGYDQAKWKAEGLVWQAVRDGLQAVVFRPGNIGHHRTTGASNPKDMLNSILYACARTGFAPSECKWMFEATPVDFFAEIVRLRIFDRCSNENIFNVINTNLFSSDDLFDLLAKSGIIQSYLPQDKWFDFLKETACRSIDTKLMIISESISNWETYLIDRRIYDCRRFRQYLSENGIEMRRDNEKYFEILVRKFADDSDESIKNQYGSNKSTPMPCQHNQESALDYI